MANNLGEDELIELVEKISNADGTEDEVDEMISILEKNVPHPEVTNLIFYNEQELSPIEIVEKALAYKPIML